MYQKQMLRALVEVPDRRRTVDRRQGGRRQAPNDPPTGGWYRLPVVQPECGCVPGLTDTSYQFVCPRHAQERIAAAVAREPVMR